MDSLPPSSTPLSIVLLAGGQGSRVGGADKGLLEWQGAPMIEHLYRQVRPLTDDLIISCNRNTERYARYADQLATDEETGYPGPMAGLRAGLALARHSRLLVLPCDVPGIDDELLAALIARQAEYPTVPLIIRQGGAWEPLLCVLPCSARGAFEAAWAEGERSPRRVMLALHPEALDCPADDPRLRNLNTLELMQVKAGPGPKGS